MAKKKTESPLENETKDEGSEQTEERKEDPDSADYETLKQTIVIEKPEEKKEEKKEETKEKPAEEKEKPHAHTIKYAEALKRSMGNLYVEAWDKLPIDKRIEKMETIAEFNNKVKEGQPKLKEGKIPTGKSEKEKDYKPSSKELIWGVDYAALGKKIHNN